MKFLGLSLNTTKGNDGILHVGIIFVEATFIEVTIFSVEGILIFFYYIYI